MRRSRWFLLVALLAAFGLIAAACGDDDDSEAGNPPADGDDGADDGGDDGGDDGEGRFAGQTVNILTPETATEAESFLAGLQPFLDETGLEVNLNATRDATTELNIALEAGDPPDVVIIPQPGRTRTFCDEGSAIPVPQSTQDTLAGQFDDAWWDLGSGSDGTRCGVPNKGDVKSLVWYNTGVFADNGYEIPETWDAMTTLTDQMIADGITPWCIAMESGDATGWHYTDWFEDFFLRLQGADVYDQWVNHEIPFNDPAVAEVAQFVNDIWFQEGAVFGGTDQIATTQFRDASIPLVAGDCAMVKQASFYAAPISENGGVVGADGTVNAFYLPTITDEFGTVVLGAGTHAVAFTDNDVSHAVVEYLGGAEHANGRVASGFGGYLSPNTGHDTSLYENDLEKLFAEILVSASPFRFDGSDLMPGEIGAGAFWREPTDYVSGAITLEEMLDNVEEEWNALG
ncbi:MAG: alpha-glucoside ABC transporter substrate-binding protein [Acidimicrobiales bacterium]|nr:MAG: alpha-glucoside ABC transporter substrate-binding protein [Acidimicrobiales bacterium]